MRFHYAHTSARRQQSVSLDLARQVLGQSRMSLLAETDSFHDGVLNMTYLALRFSHYVNGVGMHHGEVSRGMFPNYPIRAITNGVHAVSWTAPSFQELTIGTSQSGGGTTCIYAMYSEFR